MTLNDVTEVYAVPGESHIIDVILPTTGLTAVCGKTFEQVREEYPTAERVNLDLWMAEKAARQNVAVRWDAVTPEQYHDMLCVLPPAARIDGGFLVGEPDDHCARTGRPRFRAYRMDGAVYYCSSRPMTIAEFTDMMKRGDHV